MRRGEAPPDLLSVLPMSHLEDRWNATRAALRARHGDPPFVHLSGDACAPASFAQEGLWLRDRLYPGDSAYNLAVACRLRGPLAVPALERSLADLVGRHDILRTTLAMADGRLLQRVGPVPEVILGREDVPEGELDRWLGARASLPFALDRAPLFRAALARMAPEDHCLLLTQHHAILDAWSFEILMAELCAGYQAHGQHEPAPLARPPWQYGDFAAWQRRRLTGAHSEDLVAYWRAALPSETPGLALPTDQARASRASRRAASQTTVYAKPLASALRALARQEGTTLYVVLLAAFQGLLHRYAGDTDFVVGSPIAQRLRPELARMLGLLINTLPLRARLDGPSTFREVLGRARETVTGALAHQELPFELLVRALGQHRYDGAPWFQVMFAFQNVPRSHWRFPGLDATVWDVEPAHAKLDLTLTLQERDDGLAALFAYDADRFASSMVARLLDHFGNLLAGVAADPDRPLDSYALLSSAERSRVLAQGQGPTGACRPSIHRRFEAQVARSPEATALVTSQGERISYGALNARANRLARRLVGLGLGRGALVGIGLERSPALVVAQLAILKAAAAYVPIPDGPPTRVQRVLRPLAAVVTDAAAQDRVSSFTRPILPVEDEGQGDLPADNLDADGGPEDLAYVMYTSGSTGEPRAVCIRHRGVVRLVADASYARLAPDEMLLQLAPVAFDASTFEIWGALLHGATLVLAPGGPLSVAELGALVVRHRVTTLWLTSGLFELVVETAPDDLGSLRQVLTGGDVMSARHARRFRERWPRCRLVNCYGPTENTTFSTAYEVTAVAAEQSVPIGRPIANTTVHLLDRHLAPVPLGVVGEAYVGGDGVAHGYLNDAAATRARFVPNPFAAGDTLYRTGDRMRWRADGELEFVGRCDDQVKIRGFRVEPAEVEHALCGCAGVRSALVRAEEDSQGTKRLNAYVVAEAQDPELPVRLREALRARLPGYMVPAAITEVAALLITENGKRAPPPLAPSAPVAELRPRDEAEGMVARAFVQVLGPGSVGIHDSFFDVGGDSLRAIRLCDLLERQMQRTLPLAILYEHPTVAGLARALGQGSAPAVPRDAGVLTLKAGRALRPLFLIGGGRGGKPELTLCAKLVSRLGPHETVYGLLAPPEPRPVEEAARLYLATLRRLQPVGPYRVGGECIGGILAYEVAQQLLAHGETVELLLLLDSFYPSGVGQMSSRPLRQRLAPRNLLNTALALLQAVATFVAERPWRNANAAPWPVELWHRLTVPASAKRHITACMRYRPHAYPGQITILASAESLRGGLAEPWQALAREGAIIRQAPGDHASYTRRYFRQTAEQLRLCLEEGERAGHGVAR